MKIEYQENPSDLYAGKSTLLRGQGTLVPVPVKEGNRPYIKGVHDDPKIREWLQKELGDNFKLDDIKEYKQAQVFLSADRANVFDLSDPMEYIKAMIAKSSPAVSTEERPNRNATYVADNNIRRIESANATARYKRQALEFVENSDLTALEHTLYGLGMNVPSRDEEELRAILNQEADQNPERIVELRKDPADFHARIVFYMALSEGIVRAQGGAYYFNESILGSTAPSAIDWIKNPENIEAYHRILRMVEERREEELKQLAPQKQTSAKKAAQHKSGQKAQTKK